MKTRNVVVTWLYLAAVGHVAVGLLLPWIAGLHLLDGYHRGIEAYFWNGPAPADARAQSLWWMSLFGATLLSVGVFMGGLTHIGARYRIRAAWAWQLLGLAVWAPLDIGISLRAGCWTHVVMDAAALLALVPPLLWLWRHDRNAIREVRI